MRAFKTAAVAPPSTQEAGPTPSRGARRGDEPSQKRILVPALDGFRGLAAVMVVLYHCFYFAGTPELGEGFFRAMLATGYLGVDFFFVISGFVLFLPTVQNQGGFRRLCHRGPACRLPMAVTNMAETDEPAPALAWRQEPMAYSAEPAGQTTPHEEAGADLR